ncbi:MAG: ribulokinase [Halanaerobiaceae bacterium]|nr:ribulokinase [Halanaerobiaceae bacterium]
MSEKYVLGLDFGSDSVRALVVNADSGEELSSGVSFYRRWMEGKYCQPSLNQFRQHPQDYLDSMTEAVKEALDQCSPGVRDRIAGIGIDTTGSTPCAVNREGVPLALLDEFKENPNAMFILWKDHTAVEEAAEINERAWNWGGVDYTKYEGGVYSSEWFWAKILHTLREDEKVREAAFSWVEHCDWIPAVLTGRTDPLTMKRSRCAAGHKAMWHEEWGGLPPEEFLAGIDPLLAGLRERLYEKTYTSDERAGELTEEWAERLGLPAGIAVAVGAFDAHLGAIGAGIKERTLVKIMGTSTCDIMIAAYEVIGKKLIRGICGQVDGSVIPGYIGLEAGQSGFGDVYAWFRSILSWPLRSIIPDLEGIDDGLKGNIIKAVEKQIPVRLTEEAEKLPLEESGLLALDWLNGRRTPFADQTLKGAIIGLNLGTTAPAVFRALVEATAFGARAINEQFINEGVEIDEVIAIGGISKKNEFVMQVTADVLNMPVKVAESEQACALGAGITAAVAAGIYGDLRKAAEKMASPYTKTYYPDKVRAEQYQRLYERYKRLGNDLTGYFKN